MTRYGGWLPRGFSPLSGLLLAFGLFGWMPVAQAGVSTAYPCSAPANTSIQLADVSVSAGTALGPIGSAVTVNIPFNCSAAFSNYYNPGGVHKTDQTFSSVTVQAGMLAAFAPSNPPPGGGILFAITGVSGIALKLTATPNQASSVNGAWDVGTTTSASTPVAVTFTAQLVKTGTVTPGTINGITLAQFTDYNSGNMSNAAYFASLSLLAGTKVSVPSCTVSVPPVFLPSVSTSALPSGQTAGTTAFSIALSGCSSGVTTAAAYFEPGATIDSATGNLKNSSGTAANVEVQLLNGAGSSSASAFSVINLGNPAATQNSGQYPVSGGAATMNYYAQYIATGAAAGAGSVKTSVTFTLNYP
jgi:major type 1 subunit fimbrin (pilin)